ASECFSSIANDSSPKMLMDCGSRSHELEINRWTLFDGHSQMPAGVQSWPAPVLSSEYNQIGDWNRSLECSNAGRAFQPCPSPVVTFTITRMGPTARAMTPAES